MLSKRSAKKTDKKVFRWSENLLGIRNPALRRLIIDEIGKVTIAAAVFPALRNAIKVISREVARKVVDVVEHARAKTVKGNDVTYVVERYWSNIKNNDLVIPITAMDRWIREVFAEYQDQPPLRMSEGGLQRFHIFIEFFLREIIDKANVLREYRRKAKLTEEDIEEGYQAIMKQIGVPMDYVGEKNLGIIGRGRVLTDPKYKNARFAMEHETRDPDYVPHITKKELKAMNKKY
jgi:histone H3/H4